MSRHPGRKMDSRHHCWRGIGGGRLRRWWSSRSLVVQVVDGVLERAQVVQGAFRPHEVEALGGPFSISAFMHVPSGATNRTRTSARLASASSRVESRASLHLGGVGSVCAPAAPSSSPSLTAPFMRSFVTRVSVKSKL